MRTGFLEASGYSRAHRIAYDAGRPAVAVVWLYEGLWCKILAVSPEQRSVLSRIPGLLHSPDLWLAVIGLLETTLGLWVLSRRFPRAAARLQVLFLAGMNLTGLLFASDVIHNPIGMMIHNLAFLALVCMVSAEAERSRYGR